MKILSYLDSGYTPFVRRLNRRALPEPGVRDLVTSIIAEVAKKATRRCSPSPNVSMARPSRKRRYS